ncbi:hypothetical protein PHJA_000022900 [Phtheirospermum japonicum]|uniref:Uncharacterized protein n=1 Tax=Phtheirospermum japonicum TaxID=374723 RepID=A0A830B2Y5_9LAMI|nr:hypothetical protein PHJA_000022900 [Phtheirospermum japonicum]
MEKGFKMQEADKNGPVPAQVGEEQEVEQIIMDESMVQLYDLLDQFCQFIIFNLPYIRKHRDCPNDINEAASTLIFSSARFGELPELMSLRKLFGDRYGQRFIITALELRPGNLVSPQVAFKILSRVFARAGPGRAITFQAQETGMSILSGTNNRLGPALHLGRLARPGQAIRENLYIKKVSDDLKYKVLAEITSSYIQQGPLLLEYKENYEITPEELELFNGTAEAPRKNIIYLDDIEEFVSPLSKDENFQDQRLFVFKSLGMNPLNEKADYEGNIEYRLEYCERGDDIKGEYEIFQQSSLRAITLPAERTKESLGDNNVIRSNSFPYEQPRIEYSSCRHIHPKLPDYDELEAKFKELKRANLRND